MPALIILMSVILVVTSVAAYLANHQTLFLSPISLLIYREHPGFYRGVVVLIMLLAGVLGLRFWMVRDGLAVLLASLMAGLGLVLLICDNNRQPVHDHAALAIMAITGLLGVHVARVLDDWRCRLLAYAAASGVSVIPSGDMRLIGLVENLLMFSTIILVNLHAFAIVRGRYEQPWSLRTPSPGIMGGFFWAGWGLFIVSVSGGLARDLFAGPVIAAVCWTGGWLAWREDMLFRIRGTILMLSLAGGFLLVAGTGNMPALILVLFLTPFVLTMLGLYETMLEGMN